MSERNRAIVLGFKRVNVVGSEKRTLLGDIRE